VARYADTSGAGNRRGNLSRYIYAHTYRDWVVNSFNEDKPYDKFLIEQIAADRQKGKQSDLAALGFLTGRPEFLDLAIVYALINFIATIAVLKFFEYGDLGHERRDEAVLD